MADFISQLNGDQMDTALMGVAMHDPEAWAVGQRNGSPVITGDETYNNNARYYAENKAKGYAQTAQYAAARAEAAVPAGTAGAVFFDRAQSLTVPQMIRARDNIEASHVNQNLLDNAYFRGGGGTNSYPINQRKVSGTVTGNSSAPNFIDRWIINNGTQATLSVDGITLAAGAGIRQYNYFNKWRAGMTYTFSAMCSINGSWDVFSATGELTTATEDWQISSHLIPNQLWVGIRYRSAYSLWDVLMTSGQGVTIIAAKLEAGDYSSVKYAPQKDWNEEREVCRAYFERIANINGGNYLIFGSGIAQSATNASVIVPMSPKRGSSYTIKTNGSFRLLGSTNRSVSSISLPGSISSQALVLNCAATGMTTGEPVMLQANADTSAYIDVSAEPFI